MWLTWLPRFGCKTGDLILLLLCFLLFQQNIEKASAAVVGGLTVGFLNLTLFFLLFLFLFFLWEVKYREIHSRVLIFDA
jgi:uncharacterized membrane protein